VDFDLAKAQAALKTIETESTKAKGLFPDDSGRALHRTS
jgi:hypothetical protein